jgi:tRNA G18 (ribose-2'-O)-methylase SpoU
MTRGYCGIGIVGGKTPANLGTLWRSAYVFGASFIFTVGRRYPKQASDTLKTWRHVPLMHYADTGDLWAHIPHDCQVVGVELADESVALPALVHPQRAIYLLGAEDTGLSPRVLARCHCVVQLAGRHCLNVAVAGSIVLHDRYMRTPVERKGVAA